MINKFLAGLCALLSSLLLFIRRQPKIFAIGFGLFLLFSFAGSIITAKFYQNWDDDKERGAVPVEKGDFGESYSTPEYLDQGWSAADSLWFYNTTQGSALLPYDFFVSLEQANSEKLFVSSENIDRFRYLPQKETFFNPDALPVGFVKEEYQEKDYVGFTCAACHTGQINFKPAGQSDQPSRAIRIDGGPAMADMVGFLIALEKAMTAAQKGEKFERFAVRVKKRNNNYSTTDSIVADLKKWTDVIALYNVVNHSKVEYGHARLDAFGRIYNRVLQHAINKNQAARLLALVTVKDGNAERRLLTTAEIDKVLEGVDSLIIRDDDFAKIIERLQSTESGYPGLSLKHILAVRNKMFNEPNAPVSYPFLWDIAHSDYVQWNGLASNAGAGPLGRNAGEVIGVFAKLDWQKDARLLTKLTGFSLSALLSGQSTKQEQIYFKSSVDLFNLQRLEKHLRTLKSPRWPFCKGNDGKYYLPTTPKDWPVDRRPCDGEDKKFDKERAARGELLYAKLCVSCHEIIDREAWDRLVIGQMLKLKKAGTDPAMAENSVKYRGKSGNLKHTYQSVGVGKVIVEEEAPVVEILSAATAGVVATPDADKNLVRRVVDYVYTLVASFADNPIKKSVKAGDYEPDTTAMPYSSLLAYKGRSLNGIWATAPYLHNGSVPSLYDLLLPARRAGDVDGGRCPKYRPDSFMVGSRAFDPEKAGFKSEGYDGFRFDTSIAGNFNSGHDYGACRMSDGERWDLIEFLKTL